MNEHKLFFKIMEKFYEEIGKLDGPSFIKALYDGKIDKPEHIKKLQRVLGLMGIKKEQKGESVK